MDTLLQKGVVGTLCRTLGMDVELVYGSNIGINSAVEQ